MKEEFDILGSRWRIVYRDEAEDETLKGKDGYCDRTVKTIVIAKDRGDSGFANHKAYEKEAIRHEVIHAYLIESGLDGNWQHAEQYGHDETMVDWVAMQFPKLYATFKELEII